MNLPWHAVTFDCFGTLLDWQGGQQRVLEQFPSLRRHEARIPELVELRGQVERELQAGAFRSYERILGESLDLACQRLLGVELTPAERRAFAAGQLGWPAFPEAREALARLAARLPVGLLSNCDAQVLRLVAHKHFRGVPIALFVSSEEVRSYKPAPAHWGAALAALGGPPESILHVSFSREYDLGPAGQLGFALGFVARYGTAEPAGLPLAVQARDLEELADRILAAG